MANRPSVVPADHKSNDRGDEVPTKRFYGFGSLLMLGPLRVKEQQKRSLGFDSYHPVPLKQYIPPERKPPMRRVRVRNTNMLVSENPCGPNVTPNASPDGRREPKHKPKRPTQAPTQAGEIRIGNARPGFALVM